MPNKIPLYEAVFYVLMRSRKLHISQVFIHFASRLNPLGANMLGAFANSRIAGSSSVGMMNAKSAFCTGDAQGSTNKNFTGIY